MEYRESENICIIVVQANLNYLWDIKEKEWWLIELWVRSQDKEALLKVNNGLMYWEDTDKRNCVVIKETSTHLTILGTYNSKKRCLEILDEIQDILKPKVLVNTYNIEQAEFCDGTQIIKPMIDNI